MNKFKQTLLAGATLIAAAGISSQASAITIGGVDIGDACLDGVCSVNLTDASAETLVTQAGNVLQGIGVISNINNKGNYAGANELNFVYTATVSWVSPDGTTIIFGSGSLDFYVNPADTYFDLLDLNTGASSMPEAQTAIAGGTEWLNLVTTTVATIDPYNVAGAPSTGDFFGNGTNLSGNQPTGDGVGYMAVDLGGGGVANSLFDTDLLTFEEGTVNAATYDFLFTSTFNFAAPGVNPDWAPVSDASTFSGRYTVPEPGILALLGMGLVGFGFRKRMAS